MAPQLHCGTTHRNGDDIMNRIANALRSSFIPLLAIRLAAVGVLGCDNVDGTDADDFAFDGAEDVSEAEQAVTIQRWASVENGTFSEFDQTNGNVEIVSDRAADGIRSVHAWTPANAPSQTKYARGIFNLNWDTGTDIWYSVSIYLPIGFYAAQQGQVDLVRWDNWTVDPTNTDRGGIVIYGSDKKARFVRQRLGVEQIALVGPFTITEGVWHDLEVHQRFSTNNASDLTQVYMDGALMGSSTQKNWYGRPITRIRYGIVAVNDPAQTNRLDLWFDAAATSTSSLTLP
jgi:hypothetical protein